MEHNPFAPPRADMQPLGPGTGPDGEADAIRRRFLTHESVVWTIGWLYLFGAGLMVFLAFGMSITLSQQEVLTRMPNGMDLRPLFITILAVYVVLGLVFLHLGYGIRLLSNAARLGGIVFGSLFLILCAISLQVIPFLIQILLIYCLASANGRYVCSGEYREIIQKTPHIRRRRWILFVVLAFIALMITSFGLLVVLMAPR